MSAWGSPFFQHVNEHEEAFSGTPDYINNAIVRAYIAATAFTPIDEQVMKMTHAKTS